MKYFKKIANRNIRYEINARDRERYELTPAYISAIEHEFKLHEGIWSLILTNVHIKNERMEITTEALKIIAVSLDNSSRRRRRNLNRRMKNN